MRNIYREMFCDLPPEPDRPLRLKAGVAKVMLADEFYKGVDSEDLVELARQRYPRCPADRSTAIAVLKGAY